MESYILGMTDIERVEIIANEMLCLTMYNEVGCSEECPIAALCQGDVEEASYIADGYKLGYAAGVKRMEEYCLVVINLTKDILDHHQNGVHADSKTTRPASKHAQQSPRPRGNDG